MERFTIYSKTDGAWHTQHPANESTDDAGRLPLDAAEQFAYGACIVQGADAVRLESTHHTFRWCRDDDGTPGEQAGRVDACIDGRWWRYRPQCVLLTVGDVEHLARAARAVPGVQAVKFGGPGYQRDNNPGRTA